MREDDFTTNRRSRVPETENKQYLVKISF